MKKEGTSTHSVPTQTDVGASSSSWQPVAPFSAHRQVINPEITRLDIDCRSVNTKAPLICTVQDLLQALLRMPQMKCGERKEIWNK